MIEGDTACATDFAIEYMLYHWLKLVGFAVYKMSESACKGNDKEFPVLRGAIKGSDMW